MDKGKVGILVLAAGASSRMGSLKQLLPFRGRPIILHILQELGKAGFDTVTVITGAHHTSIKNVLPISIHVQSNEHWEEGMSGSIGKGIQFYLQHQPKIEACMVVLSDQPLITAEHFQDLYNTFIAESPDAVATDYSGKPGVPALFSKTLFKELLLLKGDKGAKTILKSEHLTIKSIQANCNLIDVDDITSYEQLKSFE